MAPGPRHRVDAQVQSSSPETSRQADFSRLLIDDVFRNRAKRSPGASVSFTGDEGYGSPATMNRISLLLFNSRLFCVLISFLFFFVLDAIKILQRILRGDLMPGRVLNSLGGFEKVCTGNRITRVCPRVAASMLPLRS